MEDIFDALAKKAYKVAKIGLCILGIIPAFGAIALAYVGSAKKSNVPLKEETLKTIASAKKMAYISFALFVIEVVVALVVASIYG